MIIYKIVNKKNNKCYIGQTVNDLKSRINVHFSGSGTVMQKAVKKYGKEYFDYYIIDTASSIEELNSKEIFWIKFYKSLTTQNGYNVQSGGNNKKLTENRKLFISEQTKKAMKRPEVKNKLGRVWTEEQKKEKSKQMSGLVLSESHKKNISDSLKGKKKSKKHIENIKKGKTGIKYTIKNRYYMTDEHKESIINSNKKYKNVEERNKNKNKKLKEKRKKAYEEFLKKGELECIICNETGEVFKNYSVAAKKLNINACSLREHIIGLYSHAGGYTFTTKHKTESEGN